ncbi:MAG: protein kinase [Fuerstiella sp.]
MTGEESLSDEDLLLIRLHEAVVEEPLCSRDVSAIIDTCSHDTTESFIEIQDAAECLQLLERVRRGNEDSAADESFALPQTLGRFQIQTLLGQGAHGVVYQAWDPELQRPVAIKVPRPEVVVSESLSDRFVREAEAAAALDHPGIVPIFEVGRAGGISYLVMACCDGCTLSRWLSRNPLPDTAVAVRLLIQLADAVAHAHSRGILHRDLKPANVLFEDHGIRDPAAPDRMDSTPRITDFGLAGFLEEDSGRTMSNAIVGTPSYMSPEQASGSTRQVGTAADVYSLGAMFFELLTGRPPFCGESVVATLLAVRSELPAAPGKLRPCIPRDLDAICLKCLEKEPGRRYESAAHLRDDLNRYLNNEPILARHATPAERMLRWCRRSPKLAGLTSLVVVLVMTMIGGSTIAAIWLAQAQTDVLDSLEAEIMAKDEATKSEEQAIRALYEARMALAGAKRSSERPGQQFESLDAVRAAGRLSERLQLGSPELLRRRNEAIAALALVDLRLESDWPDAAPLSVEAVVGTDAAVSRYATLGDDGRIVIRRIQDNLQLLTLPAIGTPAERPFVRFSHDGRFLAVRGRNSQKQMRIQLWKLDDVQQPVLDQPCLGLTTAPNFDFSPNDDALTFVPARRTVRIVDLASMEVRPDLSVSSTPVWLAFDLSGTQLGMILQAQRRRTVFLSTETGELSNRFFEHPVPVHFGVFSRDGQLLVTADQEHQAWVWDLATGRNIAICSGHRNQINHASFAHQAPLLATTAKDMTTKLWEPHTGRLLLTTNGRCGDFSTDDRWLGLTTGGVRNGRWEVASGRDFVVLPNLSTKSFPYDVDFSPDGRLLVAAMQHEGVAIWDAQTLRKIAHLPAACSTVTFSPDSDSIFLSGLGRDVVVWPVEYRDDEAGVKIGPPKQRWPSPFLRARLSASGDFTTVAINQSLNRLFVMDVATGHTIHRLTSPDCRFHDMSPDGHWIAAGSWRTDGGRIWNATTGELIRDFPIRGSTRVLFSPNSRRLLTCSHDGYSCWGGDGWEQQYDSPQQRFAFRSAAFSPDGDMAVVGLVDGVRLINPDDGTEYATLIPPSQSVSRCVAVGPGTRQIAVGTQEGDVFVWQIQQLRQRLRQMELDWPATATDMAPAPEALETASVVLPDFSASSEYGDAWQAQAAFDGSPETRWNSARGDLSRAWIARFWPTPQPIAGVVVHEAFDRIRGIRIQTLSPGLETWTDVVDVSGQEFVERFDLAAVPDVEDESANPVLSLEFPTAVDTRGIRLQVTSAAGSSVSIREVTFTGAP